MRIGACVGIGLLVVALAGCAPGDPVILPPETPAVEPMFASDEEALAAAEEAYAAYLAMSDQIGQAGWADPSGFEGFERGEALETDRKNAADLAAKNFRQVGASTFDSMSMQQYNDGGEGSVAISVYVCLDVSLVDVHDEAGDSVVSGGRESRVPLEVDLDDLEGAGVLKVSRSEVWSGESFC